MKVSELIKPLVVIGCVVFVICCLVQMPIVWYDCLSYIGYSITVVTVLFLLYDRWVWRFIPWNRPPVLKKHYKGIISYYDKLEAKTKHIDITVRQNLFSIKVKTRTDINESYTIASSIEQEYDSYFLYYIYITNPDASVQKHNPIQHGTCRMTLEKDTRTIKGKYWTTSQTTGDIQWQEDND